MAFSDSDQLDRMLAEHTALEGEVPFTPGELEKSIKDIRARGCFERDSLQTYGVVDISCPVLGPANNALAALTCPYLRRIDRHVGPTQKDVRALLIKTAQALSLTQGMAGAS